MRTLVLLSALLTPLLTAACTNSHELAMPKGPVFGLNAGHWTPGAGDLVTTPSATP